MPGSGPAPMIAADGTSLFAQLLPWLLVLIVVVLGGGVIIAAVRRRLRDDGRGAGGGFTLNDLRELHARGELSDEEFERARDAMISRVRASATAASKQSSSPGSSGNTAGPAR